MESGVPDPGGHRQKASGNGRHRLQARDAAAGHDEGQDVLPEDIHYYDEPPFDDGNYLAHGVDLAISTKESADYTAVVCGEITWPNGKLEIYIQPHPIIRHMSFHDTMDALDNVRRSSLMSSEFFVEAVAYQQAAIEEVERRAFAVAPCTLLRTSGPVCASQRATSRTGR